MKLTLDISSKDERYKLTPALRAAIKRAVKMTLEYEDFGRDSEVSVTLVKPDEIRQLNKEYRAKDSETDVLSFPMDEEDDFGDGMPASLGDIILCPEVIAAQAGDFDNDYEHELLYMTIHSTLHLLGYDHVNSVEEQKEMFSRQDSVFESYKILEKETQSGKDKYNNGK